MDVTASGSELRDAARLALGSTVVVRAVALDRWIGTGRRPVTAGQVLRKAEGAARVRTSIRHKRLSGDMMSLP